MIAAVVLAAGRSTRMGRSKQLLDLGGRPLLQHVLDAAEAAPVDEVILVLGHDAGPVWSAMQPGPKTRVARNPAFAEGQSSSLRAGLGATMPGTEAAVVLLGDQPEVTTAAIAAVVGAFRRGLGDVLQASYRGAASHPVLLARAAWPDARAAEGNRGARDLLDASAVLVEVPGEPPQDVDDEDGYRRLLERWRPPEGRSAR